MANHGIKIQHFGEFVNRGGVRLGVKLRTGESGVQKKNYTGREIIYYLFEIGLGKSLVDFFCLLLSNLSCSFDPFLIFVLSSWFSLLFPPFFPIVSGSPPFCYLHV